MNLAQRARATTWACSLAAATAVGCGGGTAAPSSSTPVTGNVGGQPFVATDAIGQVWSSPAANNPAAGAGVILSNVEGMCSIAQRQGDAPDMTTLGIEIAQPASSVAAGTYQVSQGSAAAASLEVTDGSCNIAALYQATGGSVTLTTSTPDLVEGTFDLTFDDGDHLTGSFSAPVCQTLFFQSIEQSACGS